jgi:hypothetical protein
MPNQHTLGPLKVESGKSHDFTPDEAKHFMATWFRLVAPDGSTVAYAADAPTARLIAAAPEMRALLVQAIDDWQTHGTGHGETLGKISALLARIEGGETCEPS